MLTLFVEWVEGKPYSRWCEPIARWRNDKRYVLRMLGWVGNWDSLRRVTGGAKGLGEHTESFSKEDK